MRGKYLEDGWNHTLRIKMRRIAEGVEFVDLEFEDMILKRLGDLFVDSDLE